jgi:hypothetical protein
MLSVLFFLYLGPMDNDNQLHATKALMVVAVGVTGRWRLPLTYYLTNGTDSDLQETIIRTILSKLWEAGCVGVSITMDGLSANIKTLQKLGCCTDPNNIVSTFHTQICLTFLSPPFA